MEMVDEENCRLLNRRGIRARQGEEKRLSGLEQGTNASTRQLARNIESNLSVGTATCQVGVKSYLFRLGFSNAHRCR